MSCQINQEAIRARADSGTPWERIIIEPTPDSYESFVGTRDDLVAAGICSQEQFPLPPRRSLSYRCEWGNWVTSKVKGGYRHQVEGREAMARMRIMKIMNEQTKDAVQEYARQMAITLSGVLPSPTGPRSLFSAPQFNMTEASYQHLWCCYNDLYHAALGVEIDPLSPAFATNKPRPQKKPTLNLVASEQIARPPLQ